MKLLIVSDAWHPQVNGVVRTLTQVRNGLIARGWEVEVLGPQGVTVACPTYSEIRLTLRPSALIAERMVQFAPDCIHIATEGPLGCAMRRWCLERGWKFTTSFHTRFPEYLKARWLFPRRWTYEYLRSFHRQSQSVLVPTPSICQELSRRGFGQLQVWGRGVDTETFHPRKRKVLPYPGPIALYVGRLAIEKNVEEFLRADIGAVTKLVVGDGPARSHLMKSFPQALFLGARFGEELAELYASSDVFVFPSQTDTFGLVLLEALASGVPVAALPVPGPVDVIKDPRVGTLDLDLSRAIKSALLLNREHCRPYAEKYSWRQPLDQFEKALHPAQSEVGEYNVQSQIAHDIIHEDSEQRFPSIFAPKSMPLFY